MRCPLKPGLCCNADARRCLARESCCISCPCISDLDRAVIHMTVLRRNRRDDAPLLVIESEVTA